VTETSQTAETAPTPPDPCAVAEGLCRLGATDKELAEMFGVSIPTLAGWIADRPDFARAVRFGRHLADAKVAHSLHRLAVGYSHPEDRVLRSRNGPLVVTVTRHYPPDHRACMSWLSNRRPELWGRDGAATKTRAAAEAFDAFCVPLLVPPSGGCHPERSEGPMRPQERSLPSAALRAGAKLGMTSGLDRESDSPLAEVPEPLLVAAACDDVGLLPAHLGEDFVGALADLAGAAAEGRAEEAAEMGLAGEAEPKGDFVDAPVVLRRIGQRRMGPHESLFLDIGGHAAQRFEQAIEAAA